METTKTESQPARKARAFEMALDIQATPDEVWRALTDAEELVRWFPLQARVTPGVGGSMSWKWEESWDWTTRIDRWEPGQLLRLVQDYRPTEDVEQAVVAMEFTLSTNAGKTRLRIVHSGFGEGASWDNELDSISEGWPAELRGLRLYLERHRGQDRQVGRYHLSVSQPQDAVWSRLTGPGGYRLSPAEPQAGSKFEVTTPGGNRLSGQVEVYVPHQTITGIVRELDDALLRIATWRTSTGQTGIWLWLSTYTGDAEATRAFEQEAREELSKLFPEAVADQQM